MAEPPPTASTTPNEDAADRWWRDGVVYQVYPRSFADSNGDGIGDLPGLIDHLDHLAGGPDSLGVDALWLSPIYPSPMLDGGYDVMDYTAIDPVFGTMDDFDRLVEGCHRRGIRLVLDLVMNHTSDQHPWFVRSRESRTGPFADFYLWRDPSGRDADGRPEPPNNWLSWFGGSAWAWEPRRAQFYLHTFLPEQPDVDWRDPGLRAEMWSMVRGWLDRGVDGFRLDVFNAFVKAADLPSNPVIASAVPGPRRWASCSRAASRPPSRIGRPATWCSTGCSSRRIGPPRRSARRSRRARSRGASAGRRSCCPTTIGRDTSRATWRRSVAAMRRPPTPWRRPPRRSN